MRSSRAQVNVMTIADPLRAAPRWFRKVFDHRIRTANERMFRRWLADPSFDPVFRAWHKHGANWAWW